MRLSDSTESIVVRARVANVGSIVHLGPIYDEIISSSSAIGNGNLRCEPTIPYQRIHGDCGNIAKIAKVMVIQMGIRTLSVISDQERHLYQQAGRTSPAKY